MPDLPHPDWPLRFETRPDGTITFAEVEQGTQAEHEASAAVIGCTRRGQRLDDTAFGVSELLWQQGPIDTERLAAELHASDERLDLTVDELIDLADATRRQIIIHVS